MPKAPTGLWIAAAAGLFLTGCIAVSTHKGAGTSPGNPASKGGGGTARIAEAVAEETGSPGRSMCHNLTVAYENDTSSAFRTVRIRCRALDASGYQVLAEDIVLDGNFVGPIAPGFKIKRFTRMCPVGSDLRFECSVVAAE